LIVLIEPIIDGKDEDILRIEEEEEWLKRISGNKSQENSNPPSA
jgi:hypothetical protein